MNFVLANYHACALHGLMSFISLYLFKFVLPYVHISMVIILVKLINMGPRVMYAHQFNVDLTQNYFHQLTCYQLFSEGYNITQELNCEVVNFENHMFVTSCY
jgi:hypothetical protein